MGGCAASRLGGSSDDEDPVALCRERKRLIRAAVDRRYDLAAAHAAYIHSLNAVAAALDIFVARLSAPTPFLITLPDPSAASDRTPPTTSSPCAYLRQTPSEPKTECLAFRVSSSPSSPSKSCSGDDAEAAGSMEEEEEDEKNRDYFFAAEERMPPSPPPDVFGWDFFNPFDEVRRAAEPAVMVGRFDRSSDEYLRAVREQEGIPELELADEEEEVEQEVKEEKLVVDAVSKMEALGIESNPDSGGSRIVTDGRQEEDFALTETPGEGRELLQALREVEDHFIRAYHSGKEVSRMLECNTVQPQAGHEEIKDNSSKVMRAIAWHRSPSLSSSHRSLLASSSNSTSWTESTSEFSDEYVGMESGSHSQTLGRLYAWEKKLYEEVKAGDQIWQSYQKKCLQLRDKEAKGAKSRTVDKARASARDLYAGIWVALRAAESISQRIQKLRDEELQPQIIELVQGLMRTWKIMLESHETQKQIMFEVNTFACPAYGKFSNDTHRLATVTLEAELRNWRSCFISYVATQRAYAEGLNGWLSKFLVSNFDYYSRARSLFPSHEPGTPPVVVISHEWLTALRKLPEPSVSMGMRSFIRTVRGLWIKQGEEQQQKRKVDKLAKELDEKVVALQKAENRVVESKLLESKPNSDMRQQVEYLSGRKEMLDLLRKKLEAEKAKHRNCMRSTHEITINGFKIGLASIFESLTQFSKDSVSMYGDLLLHDGKGIVNEMSQKRDEADS